MKTFKKSMVIFVLFFLGTISLVHVDRQCAQMNGSEYTFLGVLENIIVK